MKSRSLTLPLAFVALAGLGTLRHLDAAAAASPPALLAAIEAQRAEGPPAGGTFPTWNSGVDCANEPGFQVHAYDQDTYVIRQSKCNTYEAPFLFLLFGDTRALLLDTGATQTAGASRVVKRIVDQWLLQSGMASIPLVVAHTHGHGDHVAGDSFFQGQDWVQSVVGTSQQAVESYWGFQNYPVDVPTYDLGGRVLDVLGTPGHHASHITVYDRNTQLLLTGDIVYPGHLFVFSANAWADFVESLGRMARWAANHPVSWVVGCHVEMSKTPGVSFPFGTSAQPNEHSLELLPTILAEVFFEARNMGTTPQCQIFGEFVIHPVYLCGIGWNG